MRVLCGIAFLVAMSSAAPADVIATTSFDTGLEGWRTSMGSPLAFSWVAAGGNPGGFVRYDDNLEGPGEAGSTIHAPGEYLGDWTLLGITALEYQFDVISTGSFLEAGNYTVVLEGPGGNARWNGPRADAATPWLQLEAQVVESDWTVRTGSWDAILAEVADLRIGMELYNSFRPAEVTAIDNVVLRGNPVADPVPEPSTAALLLLSLAVAVGSRRLR